jgi:tetratricopeptide (TPR) repeat protein
MLTLDVAMFPLYVAGQRADTFAYYDSLTFDAYQRGDWQRLISTGKNALSAGYDYYYLRMRLGIAYLESFNTAKAEKQFRKALIWNKDDSNARLFLFKSLSYQMKIVEAGHLFQTMDANEKWIADIPSGFRAVAAHLDFGYATGTRSKNSSFKALSGGYGLYGQEYTERDNLMYDAGFHFQPSPAWLLYVGVQHLGINTYDRFATLDYVLQRDSVVISGSGKAYYFHPEAKASITDFVHKLNQNSFYLQAQWAGSDRWSLVAGMHLLEVRRGMVISSLDSMNLTDTAYFNASDEQLEMFSFVVPTVQFSDISWKTIDYSFSVHSRYHFGRFTAISGIGKASLNDTSLFQFNTGYQLLPLGNLKLVQQGEFYVLLYNQKAHLAYRASLAWQATPRLSFESDLLVGALNNLSEQFGYIVYNNPEKVKLRLEFSVSWLANSHLQLHVWYRLRQAHQSFLYAIQNSPDLQSGSYSIKSNTFIGGIKWIF